MASYTELLGTLGLTEEKGLSLLLQDLREDLHKAEAELREARLKLLKSEMLERIAPEFDHGNYRPSQIWSADIELLTEVRDSYLTAIERVERRVEELREDQADSV